MIIAFAGKGGVGKSTISSSLIKILSEKGLVLAVDADPNSNLGDKLGMEAYGTIGGVRNDIVKDPDSVPASISKQQYVANKVMQTLSEGNNVDLLVMGMPEGKGCYCFVNDVLKNCFVELIPRYGYVVVDNEAGMEHISRGVLPKADVFVFVSDPTVTGVRTAGRLSKLSEEMGMNVGKRILAINRLPPEITEVPDNLKAIASEYGLNEIIGIPLDNHVSMSAMEGEALNLPDDCSFMISIKKLSSIISKI